MFLSYKRGTSRGVDSYGYTLVTLTDENGRRFRTCGGGYDMLGTVTAEALQAHFADRLLKLHRRAEYFLQEGKQGFQCRRAKDARNCDYKKHSYGLTAHYGKTRKDVLRVTLDGATGFSNVQGVAKRIGVNIRGVYDKSNRRNWRLIGLEFIDTKKGGAK